ncbi:MAG: DUF4224 domain-containing protein [Nitrosomonadales bacterium]|nr:DUF4224 domain-containing protein [Nitrosomonadales bacterium]
MMFLTQNEIAELTGRTQRNAQARELDTIGIPYKRRRDNSLVVMRVCVEAMLGASNAKIEPSEPQLHLT